ncbi:MAG TPA: glycosyltransferase [Gemmatimonadaceae bacterium]|nr:glycosyltransferase [Gemmatimonadaceae bacterium]
MVTSEWPDPAHPNWVPFLVEQVTSLKNAGVDVRVFSFRGAKNPWNYMKAWLRLHELIKTGQYDLIHAQYGQSGLIALPRRLPLVVTFHGSDLMGDTDHRGRYTLPGRILVVLSKLVSHYADSIIVAANHLGRKLPGGTQYHIIPTGLDLERFRPINMNEAREELNLPKNKKIILFGGRPEMSVKRYFLARKTISLLQQDQVELLTVSNAPHEQMPLYLNAADVLLLTSRHEGSPTIIKEALACNLPIVSTDVGDVRERIGSIAGCMVCDDDRPEIIAASLRTILARDQPINGRTTVEDFDEKRLTQTVISIYQHALVRA